MSIVTSAGLSSVLDEVVGALGMESFYQEAFMMPNIYSVRQSNRRRERSASVAGLTLWTAKNPNQSVAEDSLIQQFEKTYTHTPLGKKIPVERELIDDEEFGLLQDIGQQIGATAAQTMETDAVSPFNDAFAGATHQAEDGLSICNTAHKNVDGGNSQSNSKTLALSAANVDTLRIAHRKITNHRGDKMSLRPRLLVVPVELDATAYEIVKSVGKPGTANNDLNFYNGVFDSITWDFLTGTKAWFMLDPAVMKRNMLWYQRVGVEIFGDGDLFAGTRTLGGYMRYSLGCKDWRGIMGSNPA